MIPYRFWIPSQYLTRNASTDAVPTRRITDYLATHPRGDHTVWTALLTRTEPQADVPIPEPSTERTAVTQSRSIGHHCE